ncbi:extensin family protein [Planktotalea sp.]|uniref:extensin-like domain-containing protein n=1 Tax=Planktotalea sp. TaxID=2029877 RepID=UPI003D6A555C
MTTVDNAEIVLASAAVGLPQSLYPSSRPKGLAEKVMAKRRKAKRDAARGAVCGDPALQGDVVGMVPGRINGCGVKNAIKLRSVSGVTLSQSSIMDCTTAKALKTWVNGSAKPAFGNRGGGLTAIRVAAHYACRTRNNRKGAKISEHGKGRAIDISGFKMKNGEIITVLKGWRAASTSKALKRMHKGACGPFGTVLGPNADRYHQDHFHFDTARYRSGSYCR